MKKIVTLMLSLMLVLTACLGLTACGDDKIVDPRENTITIGYTDYAPMNYTEDGVLVGFDTELAIMTFNTLGYNVRFKLIDWSNKYVELNGGTIDCIWNGFTSNGDDGGVPRAQSVDFTYNYMQNAQCIVRKNAPAVSSVSEFAGKSIAFENGSAGQSLAESYAETANLMKTGCQTQVEALTKVNTGAADYAIVDILLANAVIASGDYAGLSINEGITIDAEYYAVGFVKGSDLVAKVNEVFEFYAKTGYLQKLADKYNLSTSVITDFSSQK